MLDGVQATREAVSVQETTTEGKKKIETEEKVVAPIHDATPEGMLGGGG